VSTCNIGAFALEAGFPCSGFFASVDNPPIFNGLKAGSAVAGAGLAPPEPPEARLLLLPVEGEGKD
jgi:hypothetical protein